MKSEKYKDGININTYNLLFKDFRNLPKEDQGSNENYIAWNTIESFTKIQEKKIFSQLLKIIYKMNNIDLSLIKFNNETKQYEYNNNGEIITFNKLSNYFRDKDLKKILHSNKRYGKCHQAAIEISPSIPNSRIVTGYSTIGKIKFLHSVIEHDYNNETLILDYTMNTRMEKSQYIKLTNFVELSSFDGRKTIDDTEIMTGNIKVGMKPYLVFRDELIKDMQKNPQIFQPTEEGRKLTEEFRRFEERQKQQASQETDNIKRTK